MKANYKLSQEAEEDFKRIYRYGLERFGERQADQYLQDLIERFELLASEPDMFPRADEVGMGVRKSVCGRDTIYYEVIDTEVVIQFIIGQQDIHLRLKHWRR